MIEDLTSHQVLWIMLWVSGAYLFGHVIGHICKICSCPKCDGDDGPGVA